MIIGGMPVGLDGRVHTTFGHNPSSLRLCSFDPNLQNIPRGENEVEKWVKDCFIAPQGWVFWERDFSAIEAVLVGYFAGSQRYTRFAKLGVHAYLASHLISAPADLAWEESKLREYFKEIKTAHPKEYSIAKRIVHLSNYMGTPRRITFEYPELFGSIKEAARVQGAYFELFPEIRTWHRDLCARVDGTKRGDGQLGVCLARNPFGYVHHFYNVLNWQPIEEVEGKITWASSFGDDAKRLVSFLPQSTAAAVIKQAAKKLFYQTPAVGETMRLLIHDSILGEVVEEGVEECLRVSQQVMEAPILELPLDPGWGMGTHLSFGTEARVGRCWGEMR